MEEKIGLEYYRKIIYKAKSCLKENSKIFLEIGYMQKEQVFDIAKENNYNDFKCVKDLENRDRVIILC
jgi:hypothetical protein